MTDSRWHDDDAKAGWPADPGGPQPAASGGPGPDPAVTGTPGNDPYSTGSVPPAAGAASQSGAWSQTDPWSQTGVPSDTVELGVTAGAPRRGRTRVVVGVAAAVAVLAVAGIAVAVTSGGSGPQGSPAQVLTAAVHKADTFTSAIATYSEQVTGGTTSVNATGTVSEIRVPLQLSMRMTETVGSQTLPLSGIVTGNSIYIKFGAIQGFPASLVGKWLELKYSEIPGGNALGSMLQSMSSESPSVQLQPLLAGRGVREVGSPVIAGVQTTEYKGTFTESAVAKALPAKVRAELGSALESMTGPAHFTVWVDSQDQVRKLTEQLTVGTENVSISITFLSYNKPVTITIPSGNQVVPIPASELGG